MTRLCFGLLCAWMFFCAGWAQPAPPNAGGRPPSGVQIDVARPPSGAQPDLGQVMRLRAQQQIPAAYGLVRNQLARTDLPPEERMAWLEQMALLLQQMGQHAQARAVVEEMAGLPGYASSAFSERSASFLSDSYLAEGNRDGAVSVLARALEAMPEAQRAQPAALELRYKLAVTRYTAGDYTRAADDLLGLLAYRDLPRRPAVANILVQLYAVEVLSDTQLDQLLDQIKPEERSYEFMTILADAYRDREKSKEAADTYLEVARRFPDTLLPALSYVGPFLSQAGRLGDLEAVVRKEMEKQADHPPMMLLLSRILQMENKFDEALALLATSQDARLGRERANLLFGAGKYPEAAAAYQELLTASPRDSSLIERLGNAYLKMDRRQKALTTWKQLVEGPTASAENYQLLSDIYQRNGMTAEALDALRQARRRFPSARSSTMGMAYHWMVQGDYARGLQAFSEYVLVVGESYEFINSNIFSCVRGAQEQAELLTAVNQLYASASQYNPSQRAWMRDLRIQLLVKLGRYEEALAETEKTAEKKSQEFYQLAALFEQCGASEWAVRAYRKVGRDAAIDYPSMVLRIAQLEESLGETEAACRTLEAASAELSGSQAGLSAELLLRQAQLLLALKKAGPALALLSAPDATAALGANPQLLEMAELLRGEAYSMLGSLPRARAELLPLENSPQRSVRLLARFQLGNIHLWQNQPEEAVAYYQDIIQNELSHDLANDVLDVAVSAKLYDPEQMGHYSLALLYGWQGRNDDAIEEWRMLAALAGEGDLAADALEHAGDLYAASGEVRAASTEFGKALRFAKNADVIGRIRWALLEDVEKKEKREVPRQDYEKLIVDFPDTLFADLARRKLHAEPPTPPPEPRP